MMNSEKVLITGANSGLGFASSSELLRRGCDIVMACRSLEKAEAARQRLVRDLKINPGRISILHLDLASLASVTQAAAAVPENLYALACNAGLSYPGPPRFTSDGFEETFAVNYLGHFLLVQLVLARCSALKRIAVVSSAAHDPDAPGPFPDPDLSDLDALAHPNPADLPRKAGGFRYANSKLCMLMLVHELHRRLAAEGRSEVLVNAFNPGLVPGTGLGREESPWMRFMWYRVLPLMGTFFKWVQKPAQAASHLADLLTEVQSGGGYWDQGKKAIPSPDSRNEEKASQLWEKSMEWSGLADGSK